MTQTIPPDIPLDFLTKQTSLIVSSYKKWTGRDLLPALSSQPRAAADAANSARELFFAPFVVAASNAEADPILTYGNQTALNLWEMPWVKFTQTPGRHTAEPMHRDERQKFLETVQKNGFIDNYSGIRISSTGRRFRIQQATVWNLVDAAGNFTGQAAAFRNWEYV